MIVGICKLDLLVPGCHSLKEKRHALRHIKDRSMSRFGIPLSEVGFQDKWQRAEIGFAAVGNDRRVIEGLIQKIIDFIGDDGLFQLCDHYTEIINV